MIASLRRKFSHLDRAVLSGSWLAIVIACTGFLLDYFLNLALSQWLSPADLGDYSVAVSLAAFGGMFLLFGTDQALMQFLPRYLEAHDWPRAKGILIFCYAIVLLASLPVGAVAAVLMFFQDLSDQGHPFLFAFVCLPVVALSFLTAKTLRSFRHIVLATAPISVALPLMIMSGGYWFTLKGHVTDWDLVGLFALSFLIVLVVQSMGLIRHLRGPIYEASSRFEQKEWGASSFSLMMAAVLFLAMEQMGLYALEIFASEDDVAIYAVLVKHARFLLIVYMAVNLSVLPFIGPALNRQDKRALQRLYGTSMHIVMWGCLLPLLVFIIKGQSILAAFGETYTVSYPSLLILMGAYYFNFVAGFSVPFLQFSGHRTLVVRSIAIALSIEVLLLAALVPFFGYVGATWSMVVTLCGLSGWFTYLSFKKLGLRPLQLRVSEIK